jgi:hypothetical protein
MCPYPELVPDIEVSIEPGVHRGQVPAAECLTAALDMAMVVIATVVATVVILVVAVHRTMREEQQGIVDPGFHHPGHIASHNILVVLVSPALRQGAFVLHFPRFSLRNLE